MAKNRGLKFRAAQGLVKILSSKYYKTLYAALVELIFNGLDAARIRGITPVLDITFWKKGKHPMSPNGPAITIRDNGTGFTSEVIRNYCSVGQSAHTGRADVHGQHGVGKFAAFALGSAEDTVYYILTSTGGEESWMWKMDNNIFSDIEFPESEIPKKARALLPPQGPWTEIVIPDATDMLEPDEVRTALTNLLPIPLRPWVVNVQGIPVQPRRFSAELSLTTKAFEVLGGAVKFEFAVAEVTTPADGVFMIDSDTGRVICDITSLPPSVKGKLDPVLLNARLIGQISCPGLEAESAGHRDGLNVNFWKSPKGEKLIALMNAIGAPKARDLIGDHVSAGKLNDAVMEMQDAFANAFGPPQPESIHGGGGGGGSGGGGGGGSGGGGGGGGGGVKPKPPVKGKGGKPITSFVRVEDVTYEAMSFEAHGATPAQVRKGTVLVFDTSHPEVKRVSQYKGARLVESLVHFAIEAHVLATRKEAMGGELISQVYTLKGKVMSNPKK